MQSSDFISASSYVRVLEKRLLSGASLERAADAATLHEALRLLSQGGDYSFGSLVRPDDCENIVKAELKRVYRLCYEASPHREAVDVLAVKYDCHNLKVALKEKLYKDRGRPPYIEITNLSPAVVEAAVGAAQTPAARSELPEYLALALEDAKAAFEKTENPQSIDIAVDAAMFRQMLALCEKLGSEMITAHVMAQIDFYNLKTLLRVRNIGKPAAFLPGCLFPGGTVDISFYTANYNKTPSALAPLGFYKVFGAQLKKGVEEFEKSGNFSQLERLLDNFLVERTKQAKYLTYGPEIIYAYLYSKENEARQVRIILAGKQNGIRPEALKERLRECYA